MDTAKVRLDSISSIVGNLPHAVDLSFVWSKFVTATPCDAKPKVKHNQPFDPGKQQQIPKSTSQNLHVQVLACSLNHFPCFVVSGFSNSRVGHPRFLPPPKPPDKLVVLTPFPNLSLSLVAAVVFSTVNFGFARGRTPNSIAKSTYAHHLLDEIPEQSLQRSIIKFRTIVTRYSSKLAKIFGKSNGAKGKLKVIFHDFPGGAEGFELMLRFCYNNGTANISPSNLLLARSAAEYMEMNESVADASNLLEQTEKSLQEISYWTWSDLLIALKQCQNSLFDDSSVMLERCLDTIVGRLVMASETSPCPSTCSTDSSGIRFSCDSKSTESIKTNFTRSTWWFEDLLFLSPLMVVMLVKSMLSSKLDHHVISRFLLFYQKAKFSTATTDEKCKILEMVTDMLYIMVKFQVCHYKIHTKGYYSDFVWMNYVGMQKGLLKMGSNLLRCLRGLYCVFHDSFECFDYALPVFDQFSKNLVVVCDAITIGSIDYGLEVIAFELSKVKQKVSIIEFWNTCLCCWKLLSFGIQLDIVAPSMLFLNPKFCFGTWKSYLQAKEVHSTKIYGCHTFNVRSEYRFPLTNDGIVMERLATTDESHNKCNSKPTLIVNLISVIAHPVPKRSFLIFQLVKMTVVLHRKMIYKGNVFAPRVLLKWKTLPLKHGTYDSSSLRTRMF